VAACLLKVDPDELFGLRFLKTEEETYFMLEYDRGGMPVERYRSKQQTYFAKKEAIYLAANREGIHIKELGIPNFRVATVTTTRSRVDEMADSLYRLTNGKGLNMFLFIDEAALARSNPIEAMWTTGKRTTLCLFD
jgi:hypothetical protein